MRKLLLTLMVSLVMCNSAQASPVTSESLSKYFTGFDGAFVFVNVKTGKTVRYKPKRCAEQVAPCSTFKIFNALAGLDSGVLTGPEHKMKWDGQTRRMTQWNKDHTLQTAITDSVVWYFQNVAQQVGMERMQKYVDGAGYGNRDLSGGLTEFWLGNSLKISPDEQVGFIQRLLSDALPFSTKSQETVKSLIELKHTPHSVFCGKTGTLGKSGKTVMGWFVGYVVHDGHPYVFATNIKAADGALGRKARQITEKILSDADLM